MIDPIINVVTKKTNLPTKTRLRNPRHSAAFLSNTFHYIKNHHLINSAKEMENGEG